MALQVKGLCLAELSDCHNEILNAMGENACVDAIYFDFTKVCDKVDFGSILQDSGCGSQM